MADKLVEAEELAADKKDEFMVTFPCDIKWQYSLYIGDKSLPCQKNYITSMNHLCHYRNLWRRRFVKERRIIERYILRILSQSCIFFRVKTVGLCQYQSAWFAEFSRLIIFHVLGKRSQEKSYTGDEWRSKSCISKYEVL